MEHSLLLLLLYEVFEQGAQEVRRLIYLPPITFAVADVLGGLDGRLDSKHTKSINAGSLTNPALWIVVFLFPGSEILNTPSLSFRINVEGDALIEFYSNRGGHIFPIRHAQCVQSNTS
ncbi:uncharacterized protein BDR25DRAFT_356552 [Lindgomyces ingoldianus]|uniref:Uncharacterized protein n=1 Tax=Lindgomyces ingoldianus TaxID=673940 RepID=A0ACB6QRW5_9PLEO|nr:uncharacterized protein BDR25DRAFT_356552 [Lindgomyces ingoldianus]KAF2469313.1 hypothetical protein BDR25DRAFT_356552 [Lindgomyces ingoldianus]